MKIYSFDKYKLDREPVTQLFDLFRKNIVNTYGIKLSYYIVPREYEMRLDRISEFLYGSSEYVEELMVLNNIMNPYSVKQGQYIYHCDLSDLAKLYTKDNLADNEKTKKSIESTKNKKTSSRYNENLPLTVKPGNLEQIKVSDDFTIQIINSFE